MSKEFVLVVCAGILLSFVTLIPFDSMTQLYAINQTANIDGTQLAGSDDAVASETADRVHSLTDERFQGLTRSGHPILNSQQNVIQVGVCVIVESPGASC
ncbi:MAG: hypothetical protein ACRD8W_31920 [Nitrososphaeraceae archaeon]